MNIEDKLKLVLLKYIEGNNLQINNSRHYQKVTFNNKIIAIFFYHTRELYFTKYFSLYLMLPPKSVDSFVKVFFEEVILPSLNFPHNSKTYNFAGLYDPD